MIGRVDGPHSASFCKRATCCAIVHQSRAPYGTRNRARSRPLIIGQHDLAVGRSPRGCPASSSPRCGCAPTTEPSWLASTLELLRTSLRCATDMEGAHGQLRARLADRLRRDDAHRLADVHRRAAREVTAVAMAADPK